LLMKFSILILNVPSRFEQAARLYNKLLAQVGTLPVEILMLTDNKKRSIGDKRNDLVVAARGEYLAFIDDDDDVADDYVAEIMKAIEFSPDVIVFNEQATLNGENPFIVRPGVEYVNEPSKKIDGKWMDIRRRPWHWCVWKSSIAKTERVPDMMYGEDSLWVERLFPKVRRQERINKVLRYYRYNKTTSEAGK